VLFLSQWAFVLSTYKPSSVERISNLALLMDAIVAQAKFDEQRSLEINSRNNASRLFSNIKDKEKELISWRYKMIAWRGPLFLHLVTTEPWNSQFNQYQRELCFRNITYEQVLKRSSNKKSVVPFGDSEETRYVAYMYCYEHHYSFYKSSNDETTNILAISGKGTLFDPDIVVEDLESLPDSLIVLVEVSSNVHWSEPFDIDISILETNLTSTRFEWGIGQDSLGFYVCFVDSRVFYLKKNTPLALLSQLGTIEGARNNDRHELLKGYILNENKNW